MRPPDKATVELVKLKTAGHLYLDENSLAASLETDSTSAEIETAGK